MLWFTLNMEKYGWSIRFTGKVLCKKIGLSLYWEKFSCLWYFPFLLHSLQTLHRCYQHHYYHYPHPPNSHLGCTQTAVLPSISGILGMAKIDSWSDCGVAIWMLVQTDSGLQGWHDNGFVPWPLLREAVLTLLLLMALLAVPSEGEDGWTNAVWALTAVLGWEVSWGAVFLQLIFSWLLDLAMLFW